MELRCEVAIYIGLGNIPCPFHFRGELMLNSKCIPFMERAIEVVRDPSSMTMNI